MEDNSKYIIKRSFRKNIASAMISVFVKLGIFGLFAFFVSHYLGTEMLNIYVITNTLWTAIDLTFICAGSAAIRDFNVALNNNDTAAANRNVNRIMWFALIVGVALTIAGMLSATQITDILGIQAEHRAIAAEYIFWLMPTMLIVEIVFFAGYILTADSNFRLLFIMDLLVFSSGIILIILFLGVMDMGIMGVLWASVISNIVWGMLFILHLTSKRYNFKLSFELPNKETLKSIWSFFMVYGFNMFSFAIIITYINKSLIATFPIEVASAFILMYSIYSYVLMPLGMGIINVSQPLISVFHAEQNVTGVRDTFLTSIRWAMIISFTFVAIALLGSLFFDLDYGEHTDSVMHILRLYLVFAPFLVLADITGDFLVILKKRRLASVFVLFYNIIVPSLVLIFILNSGEYKAVWMLLGLDGLLAVVIIALYLKLKYKSISFEALLGKGGQSKQFFFLIRAEAANEVEEYQEMAAMFLSQNSCDKEKIDHCKIVIGELFEHSQESRQRKNSYIDIHISILENRDVRIRTKFENDSSVLNIVPTHEQWLNLNILQNISKEFSYNQFISFNVMDIVI